MSNRYKIRILLFIISLVLVGTAITLNVTFHKEEILARDAGKIEKHLQEKERFVRNFLNNQATFDSLRIIEQNEVWSQKLIPEFRDKRNIYLNTYFNNRLKFWGSENVLPETDQYFAEGSSFYQGKNGWYEVIKKSQGGFSVVCFIPVKWAYPYENRYLQNKFAPDIITSNDVDIASIEDRADVYNVRSIDGRYLFSLKLKSTVTNTFYSALEFWIWILAAIFGLILLNYCCVWLVRRGWVYSGFLLLAAGLAAFRLLELEWGLFNNHFNIEFFDPRYYASGYIFPSIGDLLINVLTITWLITFIYNYRDKIGFTRRPSRWASRVIFILLGTALCYAGFLTNNIFYGVVTGSNINFDVTNVIKLNWVSWLGIAALCLSALILYLLAGICFAIVKTINLPVKEQLLIFLSALLLAFCYKLFFSDFNIFFLLFGIILFVMAWCHVYGNDSLRAGGLIFMILVFAVISSIKLSRFQSLKERESRKMVAQRLEAADDPNAVLLFSSLEKELVKDPYLVDYYQNPLAQRQAFNSRLSKLYFSGYLSKYDVQAYEFNDSNDAVKGDMDKSLDMFKNLVVAGAIKVSEYFYRVNNTFGTQTYFGLIPVMENDLSLGTLVIELKSKRTDASLSFPELLVDGKIKEDQQLNEYSYAFYTDGRLLRQFGSYIYDLANYDFASKVREFVFIRKKDAESGITYSHLVYRPNQRQLIVVSRPVNNLLNQLVAVSFIFVMLLIFTALVLLVRWLWKALRNYNFGFRNFRWKYLLASKRILYKTRIQVSMVGAVVMTLLITGVITFYNSSYQYKKQQEKSILDKLNKISDTFDKQLFRNGVLDVNEQTELAFNTFAEVNTADLNVYDPAGDLILSTQPKIFEYGLIERKMNALAYVFLSQLQKSEFINNERIGNFKYISGYTPLRNGKNEIIAYLGLPYFSNQRDYDMQMGLFLNTLINVYALVFVAIGFFAVFLANQITYPLTMVQRSLSMTKIGRRNEPIEWKRQDEIGNLVKEYNNMIAALEDSANKLAISERESAWREMAKQVAHEIKNPLTPLKLGVQLLEKSWAEQDPRFDEKFKRFSQSFVEQIDSLSHIASEFSNFAKMPDTVLEKVDLNLILANCIEVFQTTEEVKISYESEIREPAIVMGDHDQLLRCFNNLIKNAIEATGKVRNAQIIARLKATHYTVQVEISDNGGGIPDKIQSQIFTPNFTTKSSGTGLGLAFVKQAIQNMAGTVYFETSDRGTSFYISIPRAQDEEEAA